MNNQIPKFRELVMGNFLFSVQNMNRYCVLYRLYRFIQKLIKFLAQLCFLHGIRALVFLRAFYVQPSLLGPFLCNPHCCTQPLFLGISVQPSLLYQIFSVIFQATSCQFFASFSSLHCRCNPQPLLLIFSVTPTIFIS